MHPQGLTLIFTGNGKGKTTAAFGQALRAAGHGLKVCIIQFIKSSRAPGEIKALAALEEYIEIHVTGSGFTWKQDPEIVREKAHQGWALARGKMMSDHFEMIILEELTYLINYGILEEKQILAALKERPARQHVIITGRDAGPNLIEMADLVTEMKEIKHHYARGIKAQAGIEF
jgi:cob(I)alamin adenosyltransferase